MRDLKYKLVWGGIAVIFFLLIGGTLHAQPSGIYTEVTPGERKPHDTITFVLGVNDVPDIYFFGIEISFDEEVVEFVDMEVGELMDGGLNVADLISADRVGASVTRTDMPADLASGGLMEVTFRIRGTAPVGESEFRFSEAELSDSNGGDIPVTDPPDMAFESESGIGDLMVTISGENEMTEGETLTVSGKIFVNGVTDSSEESPGIDVWLGLSDSDSDPSDWDEELWTGMEFTEEGDEDYHLYSGEAGFQVSPGTYYIALRARFEDGSYRYGGQSDNESEGFWDGVTNRSATLVIRESPAFIYTIAEWNFDDESFFPSRAVFTNRQREVTAVGANVPGFVGGSSGRAASTNGWDGGGEGSKYWHVSFSTENLGSITVSSRQSGSSTGPRDFRLEASLDSADWDVIVPDITVDGNWTSAGIEGQPLPQQYEDKEAVHLRWIVTSNTEISGEEEISSGGTNRLDDVTIKGENLNPVETGVWPGDTDDNEAVDEQDVLPLGIYWLQEGPAPVFNTIDWEERTVAGWIPEAVTHADADGNGIVDHRDLKVIGLNFGSIRSGGNERSHETQLTEFRIDSLEMGERVRLEVGVEKAIRLTGLSYSLSVRGAGRNDYTFNVRGPGSWGQNEDLLSFQKETTTNSLYAGAYVFKGYTSPKDSNELLLLEFTATRTLHQPVYIVLEKASYSTVNGTIKPVDDAVIGYDIIGDGAPRAGEVFLLQNYPNPFYPETVIVYQLLTEHDVQLDVFDITGRHVSTLVQGFRDSGVYEESFDAAGLAGGVYFYRLKAGNHVLIKKMVVIR